MGRRLFRLLLPEDLKPLITPHDPQCTVNGICQTQSQQILNDMWDSAGDFVNDNTLTVYVRRLRKKLEQEDDEPVIQTVRGIGYRMD